MVFSRNGVQPSLIFLLHLVTSLPVNDVPDFGLRNTESLDALGAYTFVMYSFTKLPTDSDSGFRDRDESTPSSICANPSSPGRSPCGNDKIWTINTRNDEYVVLVRFASSYMNCDTDYVQVLDGTLSTAPTLGKWCDGRTSSIRSTGKTISIHFHTQANVSKSAVFFKYRADINPGVIQKIAVAMTAGLAVGFIVCIAYMAAFVFFLYRKRKHDKDLISTTIVAVTNDSEDVMTTGGLKGQGHIEADDIQLQERHSIATQQDGKSVDQSEMQGDYGNRNFQEETDNSATDSINETELEIRNGVLYLRSTSFDQ